MANKPSGVEWVRQFPTSRSLNDLKTPFAANMAAFHAALKKAKATIRISATFRPRERAYLMHWSFMIAKGKAEPSKIPPMSGVPIDWTHGGNDDEALAAAKAMFNAYDIVKQPALNTRHTQGLAIDMTISWSGTLSIDGADGKPVQIKSSPRSGMNKELWSVGKGYKVIKLTKGDPPHWSSDGH